MTVAGPVMDAGAAQAQLTHGDALRTVGRLHEAILCYTRAARLAPDSPRAQYCLGAALEQAGQYAQALECFDRVLAQESNPDALLGRGNCLCALGSVDHAIDSYRALARQQPAMVDAHVNLGVAFARKKEFATALIALERALTLQPAYAPALQMRDFVLREMVAGGDARGSAEPAVQAERLYQRSLARAALGCWADVASLLEQALALQPAHGAARADLAAMLVARGNTRHRDRAMHLLDDLVAEAPDEARHWFNRSLLLYNLGEFAQARAGFERALALDPQARIGRLNLGYLDLTEGDYERGWQGQEARWHERTTGLRRRPFAQPLWLGEEPITGRTLLVHAEQGLGDTIHFSRYVHALAAHGARPVLEVQAPLVRLMRRWLDGVAEVLERGQALPPFDLHCPLMSLPLAFKTTLATIPLPHRTAAADASLVQLWRTRLGQPRRLRVGLAWSGNPAQENDPQRSIPLQQFVPMMRAANPGAGLEFEFVALQNQLRADDRAALAAAPALQYFGDAIEDFEHAAALASLCDVVISACTAGAHLAATMGRPTWILLPYVADWRWLRGRPDSPWYPTARLFRQPVAGDWPAAIREATDALLVRSAGD